MRSSARLARERVAELPQVVRDALPTFLRENPNATWTLALRVATPTWADRSALRAVYRTAVHLRRSGSDIEVDHIVPLQHEHVCGLHVPANLRIVPRRLNGLKSNRRWPDMWAEQVEWLPETPEPHQRTLL